MFSNKLQRPLEIISQYRAELPPPGCAPKSTTRHELEHVEPYKNIESFANRQQRQPRQLRAIEQTCIQIET